MGQFNKRQFRVLWSFSREDWIVAPEIAIFGGNSGGDGPESGHADPFEPSNQIGQVLLNGRSKLSVLISIMLAGPPVLAIADGLSGATVAHGSATVSIGNQASVVQQSSDKAVIDWQKFSVHQGHSLTFIQPSSSAIALNRVTGNDPSQINGLLSANGQVWLLNPNGVMVGKTGEVNVGGFLASTMAISNADFVQGKYQFSAPGNGLISNLGSITAKSGYAVLAGTQVVNDGLVQANLGQVVLTASKAMTLDLAGDKLLSFEVTQPITSLPIDGKAAIENSGRLVAQGGRVVMTARVAADMMQSVINTTGVVEASSARMVNGEIVLDGGNQGLVAVSGTLNASGVGAGESGGKIKLLGESIAVKNQATVEARGDTAGGIISIGAGWRGALVDNHGPAKNISITAGSVINASAMTQGSGGEITVWADVSNPLSITTVSNSSLLALGGASGGNGGRIETSAHKLKLENIKVDAHGPRGLPGTWLLDPEDLTIADDGDITPIDLQNALISADVTIEALAGSQQNLPPNSPPYSKDVGNILINSPFAWDANKLTLRASNDIRINAALRAGGTSSLELEPGYADSFDPWTGSRIYDVSAKVEFGRNTDGSFKGRIDFVELDGITARYGKYVKHSEGWTIYDGYGSPLPVLKIKGEAYELVSKIGSSDHWSWVCDWDYCDQTDSLQKISNAGVLSDPSRNKFALSKNIDATETNDWVHDWGGFQTMGFVPAGADAFPYRYGGKIEGLGHSISDLLMNAPGTTHTGLIAVTSSDAVISNLDLVRPNITGSSNVGALVGINAGTIQNVRVISDQAAGSVTGVALQTPYGWTDSTAIGGLVGTNLPTGVVSGSAVSVSVNAVANSNSVGGLIGINYGTVENSKASGAVTAGVESYGVGGLVGNNSYYPIDSYTVYYGNLTGNTASGNVTAGFGSHDVGGLVGSNAGTIIGNQARGDVHVNAPSSILASELVVDGGSVTVTAANHGALVDQYVTFVEPVSVGGVSINGRFLISYVHPDGNSFTFGVSGVANTNNPVQAYLSVGTSSTPFYNSNIGGLVGYNYGRYSENPQWNYPNTGGVSQSSAHGSVSVSTNFTNVGGLIGSNEGALVETVSSAGSVTAGQSSRNIGGLIGNNSYGTLASASAAGAVTVGENSNYIGGLIGYNSGSVSLAEATGNLSIGSASHTTYFKNIGGLVGTNQGGSVLHSSASGEISVSGAAEGAYDLSHEEYWNFPSFTYSSHIGGLIGLNDGAPVSDSRATGLVTAINRGTFSSSPQVGSQIAENIGGLVGWNISGSNSAFIDDSVASGQVIVKNAQSVGGLVGLNQLGVVTSSFALGKVSAASFSDRVGGLLGQNYSGRVERSGALGSVEVDETTSGSAIGALIGLHFLDNPYPDTTPLLRGNYASGTLTGVSSAQLVGSCEVYSSGSIGPCSSSELAADTLTITGLNTTKAYTGTLLSNDHPSQVDNPNLYLNDGQPVISGLATGVVAGVYHDSLTGAKILLDANDDRNILVSYINGSLTITGGPTGGGSSSGGSSSGGSGSGGSGSGGSGSGGSGSGGSGSGGSGSGGSGSGGSTSTVDAISRDLGLSSDLSNKLTEGLKTESAATVALIGNVLQSGGAAAAESVAKLLELTGSSGGSFQEVVTRKATESLSAIRQPAVQPSAPSSAPAPAPAASPQSSQPAPAGGGSKAKSDATGDAPEGPSQSSAAGPAPVASSNAGSAASAASPNSSAPAPAVAASAPPPIAPSVTAGGPPPPPVASPPPSPVAAEKPPTPKDTADSGDKTLAAAAPPSPSKPPAQARAPATQTVAVSPLVSTQASMPPRPPAGAGADQRMPTMGNSARW